MNQRCSCYRTKEIIKFSPSYIVSLGGHSTTETVGVCFGTPEQDICYCNGDKTKCSCYPEIKEKAIKEANDSLEKIELEFYRYYMLKHDLIFDAMNEYERWKKNKYGK